MAMSFSELIQADATCTMKSENILTFDVKYSPDLEIKNAQML